MISIKSFFKQKMAQFLLILFAGFLLLSNVVIFAMSSIQYNRQLQREQDAFAEMMVHLITMEDTDTAITYMQHYYHIHGISIAYYDSDGTLLYETTSAVNERNVINLEDNSGNSLGTIYYDDQESVLGSDLSLGLILINGFSLLLFFVFLKLLYRYLNSWYALMESDFQIVGQASNDFHFNDIENVSERLRESLDSEIRLKEYQKEYVKMLAHDIKTPLTVVKAYLEGVKLKRIDLDEEILQTLLAEVDEIENMVPKFMHEDIESTVAKQNLTKIIQTIIKRLEEVFKTRNIEVKSTLDQYTMEISYLDITRIVEHLLFNAFYYNKTGGSIFVTLDAKTETLTVEDTGIGMDLETITKIQNGIYRTEQAKSLNTKGSGLGLKIVREILDRQNLSLQIESKLGTGTKMMIKLKPENNSRTELRL